MARRQAAQAILLHPYHWFEIHNPQTNIPKQHLFIKAAAEAAHSVSTMAMDRNLLQTSKYGTEKTFGGEMGWRTDAFGQMNGSN